jgi:hypothetical protein
MSDPDWPGNPMRIFGADHAHLERVGTPPHGKCSYCQEGFDSCDIGFVLDSYTSHGVFDAYYHQACFLATIIPFKSFPDLGKREAALEGYAEYHARLSETRSGENETGCDEVG